MFNSTSINQSVDTSPIKSQKKKVGVLRDRAIDGYVVTLERFVSQNKNGSVKYSQWEIIESKSKSSAHVIGCVEKYPSVESLKTAYGIR